MKLAKRVAPSMKSIWSNGGHGRPDFIFSFLLMKLFVMSPRTAPNDVNKEK